MTTSFRKKTQFHKICRRCDKMFETSHKFGKICDKCMQPRGWKVKK